MRYIIFFIFLLSLIVPSSSAWTQTTFNRGYIYINPKFYKKYPPPPSSKKKKKEKVKFIKTPKKEPVPTFQDIKKISEEILRTKIENKSLRKENAVLKEKLKLLRLNLLAATKKISQLYSQAFTRIYLKGTFTKTYVVKRGDCLWKIAALPQIYGDPYKWLLLYHANKNHFSLWFMARGEIQVAKIIIDP